MKVKYLGNAQGQANIILISGMKYERGESYTVGKDAAKALVARGGFVELKPKSKPPEGKE